VWASELFDRCTLCWRYRGGTPTSGLRSKQKKALTCSTLIPITCETVWEELTRHKALPSLERIRRQQRNYCLTIYTPTSRNTSSCMRVNSRLFQPADYRNVHEYGGSKTQNSSLIRVGLSWNDQHQGNLARANDQCKIANPSVSRMTYVHLTSDTTIRHQPVFISLQVTTTYRFVKAKGRGGQVFSFDPAPPNFAAGKILQPRLSRWSGWNKR
jgi:hypothetical protein